MTIKPIEQRYGGKFNNLTEITDEYVFSVLKMLHPDTTIDGSAIEYIKMLLNPLIPYSDVGNDKKVLKFKYKDVEGFINNVFVPKESLLRDTIKSELERSKITYMRYPIVDQLLVEILEHSGYRKNITMDDLDNIMRTGSELDRFFTNFNSYLKIMSEP
jgi:hypothetical protein